MYKQRKAIMQRAKLFGIFCAAMLLCVPCFNVASARESRQIIRVGSFPYEGQLMVDVYGNYSGYGFDYLQEISTYTGWQYEFVDAPWQECLFMLERGEIDIMGAVMRSPERENVYDFSDHPVGSGYGVLATCLDNETLPYNDLNAIRNLKIGVLKGNLQMNSFLKYCAQYGFTPHLQQYSTQNDLDAALDAGKIEAVVHSSVLRSEKLRVIAKFGENDSYFATTKGNTRLLSQLNYAMMQIRLNNPYFNSDLNEKYYNLQAATPISPPRA